MARLTRRLDMIEKSFLNSWETNDDPRIASMNYTLLIRATMCNRLDLVEKHLKETSEHINAVETSEKRSALIYAAMHGDVDIAKLLIEHGADTTIIDDYGYNALYIALGQRYDREKENDIDQVSQCIELAKLLIYVDEGSDIEFGDNDTTNPDKLENVKQALLELKAEVKAVKAKEVEMSQLLHNLRRCEDSSRLFGVPRDVVKIVESYAIAPMIERRKSP